jgi:hypothetical protein
VAVYNTAECCPERGAQCLLLGPTRTIGDVRSCAAVGAIADFKRVASSRPALRAPIHPRWQNHYRFRIATRSSRRRSWARGQLTGVVRALALIGHVAWRCFPGPQGVMKITSGALPAAGRKVSRAIRVTGGWLLAL